MPFSAARQQARLLPPRSRTTHPGWPDSRKERRADIARVSDVQPRPEALAAIGPGQSPGQNHSQIVLRMLVGRTASWTVVLRRAPRGAWIRASRLAYPSGVKPARAGGAGLVPVSRERGVVRPGERYRAAAARGGRAMTAKTDGAAARRSGARVSGRGTARAAAAEQPSRADRVARGKDARAVAPLD